MPKMFGNLIALKLSPAIVSSVRSRFKKINRDGVKAWVETAAAVIPQWSGMSRATLKKLGDRVGVPVAAFPVPGPSGRQPPNRVAEGEAQSEGKLIEKSDIYGFFYRTSVFHLAVNENNDANERWGFRLTNPGPYNFRLKADLAYFKEIRSQLSKFDPNLKKFISVKKLRLG